LNTLFLCNLLSQCQRTEGFRQQHPVHKKNIIFTQQKDRKKVGEGSV